MRYEVKAVKDAGVASLSVEAASDADAMLRAQGLGYKVKERNAFNSLTQAISRHRDRAAA